MSSKLVVVIGLIVALVAITFPFWYALAAGGPLKPEWKIPEGKCVETNMRARHMSLLNEWRDSVVRKGEKKPYVSEAYGTLHERSLTRTCLSGCHAQATDQKMVSVGKGVPEATRARFCNQCHDYANVRPTCWDCHVEPQGE